MTAAKDRQVWKVNTPAYLHKCLQELGRPICVCLFKIGYLPPPYTCVFIWKRPCSFMMPHVNVKYAEQGFNPLDSLG